MAIVVLKRRVIASFLYFLLFGARGVGLGWGQRRGTANKPKLTILRVEVAYLTKFFIGNPNLLKISIIEDEIVSSYCYIYLNLFIQRQEFHKQDIKKPKKYFIKKISNFRILKLTDSKISEQFSRNTQLLRIIVKFVDIIQRRESCNAINFYIEEKFTHVCIRLFFGHLLSSAELISRLISSRKENGSR